jgi:hypothetical protein
MRFCMQRSAAKIRITAPSGKLQLSPKLAACVPHACPLPHLTEHLCKDVLDVQGIDLVDDTIDTLFQRLER